MTKVRRTRELHIRGVETFEIEAVKCHYCKSREATSLQREKKSGIERDVCSQSTCLEHTEEDPAHLHPKPDEQQKTLF